MKRTNENAAILYHYYYRDEDLDESRGSVASCLIERVLGGQSAGDVVRLVCDAPSISRQSHADKQARKHPKDATRSRAAKASAKKDKQARKKGMQKYHQSAKGKAQMRKLARFNKQARSES